MNGKRLYSVIIAGTMAFGSAPTVLAADLNSSQLIYASEDSGKSATTGSTTDEQKAKITKDTAKDIAKKTLKENFATVIDEAKYQTSISFRPNYEYDQQGYVWDISWNQNSSQETINIGVSIDAITGKVLRVNKYQKSNGQSTISTITEDKARESSDAFLKKLNPEEFKQVQLIENKNLGMYYYNPVNYSFNYIRMVNGIKFDGNMISVEVNGTTGKIMGYNYRWTDNINLPSDQGIIGSTKAEEAFKKQVKLNLSYVSYMDKYTTYQDEKNIKLIYIPDISQVQLLDAKEGKILNGNGNSMPVTIVKDLSADERESFYKGLIPFQILNKEIDKDRATEIASKALKELYGEGYEVDSLNYSEGENNYGSGTNKLWSASFRKVSSSDPKMSEGGQIIIDALTEAVINLYKYNSVSYDSQSVVINYSWEQMYSKAIATLGKYFPDKAKEVNTTLVHMNEVNDQMEKYYPGMYTNYHFERVVNGIPFRDNSIDVSFSPVTGELTELRCSWDNKITFPEAKNTLAAGEEVKIYFSANKPELAYIMINKSSDYSKPLYEAKLVYRLYNSVAASPVANIDAFSGKYLDDSMQEIDDNIKNFKNKVKGNIIEKELTILAAQGVIDTKTFEINSKVTKMDLIKMLVNARGYRPGILSEAAKLNFSSGAAVGDMNYRYLQMAVYYGIIENREGKVNLNEVITREDMAKTLVKHLGYDKLAQAKDIFVINSSDAKEVSSANKGYVAIAKGMGILTITQNKLRPKATATMGELALGIYQVLGNFRSNY